MQAKIRSIATKFDIYGNYLWAETIKEGHINDTSIGVFNQAGIQIRYIFQRINHNVFKKPYEVMENICYVTEHIRNKLSSMRDASRRVMTIVPTLDGKTIYRDDNGNYWRCYLYIERARTYNIMELPEHAYQAALAFGVFQGQLADLDINRLHTTIPDFHNTPARLKTFDNILAADPFNRAIEAKDELAFIDEFRPKASTVTDLLENGGIPVRITHNDTKLNNVMLDDETGEAICVIDLDTVMPGASVFDFGDLVRCSVSPVNEDEIDLSKVCCRMDIYSSLAQGYLDGCDGCLTQKEIELMPFSGQLIGFELAVRFLTDYIAGDVFFKVHREHHNLDRAKNQFRLVKELMKNEDKLAKITAESV